MSGSQPPPRDRPVPPRPGSSPSIGRPVASDGRARVPVWWRRHRPKLLWSAAILVALAVGLLVGIAIGRAGAASKATATSPSPSTTASLHPTSSPTRSAGVVSPTLAPSAEAAAIALAQLEALATVSGHADRAYDRALFGDPWTDVDRNGCDTRNDILGRDLLDPVFKAGTNDCKVLSGRLLDPYDGSMVDFVSGATTSILVQIDHVVALGWAWRHGAESWTDERRLAFANDPLNLVASSEQTNQEKSASGPSEWLPPSRDLQCGYVENWIGVLYAYELGINPADRSAAEQVLMGC